MGLPRSARRHKRTVRLIGLFFLLLLGSGAASIHYLYQLNNELKVILNHEIPLTEMIARITVHKLEQTSWFERALRHAETAARGQQSQAANTRLLTEAKAKFQEFTNKVNKEIDTASEMTAEARNLAQAEEMGAELERVAELLVSLRNEYDDYVERVDELFALFLSGDVDDVEQIATETERLEDAFNQRLEGFLFEIEELTRVSLLSIGEREGKAIILIAMIFSVALLFMVVALFFNIVDEAFRKARPSRQERN